MTFLPHHITVAGPQSRQERTAVVLHGILGSGKNWRSFCRRLLAACPTWQFVLPDLRHHGASQGAPGEDTVEACSEDIAALCQHHGWSPAVVIGHSFGGKVALQLAAHLGKGVYSVWALDTPPGRRGAGARGPGSEIGRVLSVLQAIDVPVSTRDEVSRALVEAGFSSSMGAWMMTNLRSTEQGYVWRFELAAVEALIANYFDLDLWPTIRTWEGDAAVHLLAAGRGGRWAPSDRTQANAAQAAGTIRYVTLPDSGHWVHVDDPVGLARLLVADLGEIDSKMAHPGGPE